jgi:hypothetical protein
MPDLNRRPTGGTAWGEIIDLCLGCIVITISLILAWLPTAARWIDEDFDAPPLRSAINMASGIPPAGRGTNAPLGLRKPRRITITIPEIIYTQLLECSNSQGRSISNLAAYLLEQSVGEALDDRQSCPNHDLDNRQAA